MTYDSFPISSYDCAEVSLAEKAGGGKIHSLAVRYLEIHP